MGPAVTCAGVSRVVASHSPWTKGDGRPSRVTPWLGLESKPSIGAALRSLPLRPPSRRQGPCGSMALACRLPAGIIGLGGRENEAGATAHRPTPWAPSKPDIVSTEACISTTRSEMLLEKIVDNTSVKKLSGAGEAKHSKPPPNPTSCSGVNIAQDQPSNRRREEEGETQALCCCGALPGTTRHGRCSVPKFSHEPACLGRRGLRSGSGGAAGVERRGCGVAGRRRSYMLSATVLLATC